MARGSNHTFSLAFCLKARNTVIIKLNRCILLQLLREDLETLDIIGEEQYFVIQIPSTVRIECHRTYEHTSSFRTLPLITPGSPGAIPLTAIE